MFLRLLPATLSLLLLGAHFLRDANLLMTVLTVACTGLLWVRKPWAAYTVQTILALGVAVWLLEMGATAGERMQTGRPWLRMAGILSAVSAFTFYSAWHFRHPKLRAWFGTGRTGDGAPTAG